MDKWPSDKVERKPTNELIPYARNSRTHSEEQIGQIAASIKEWGFTTPILVDEDNEIIAGHGRLLAAQKLDIKEVPVMVAEDWTEAQKKAYVIADNKLALNAGWDTDMLKIEIDNLKDLNFDINLIGFGDKELSDLFHKDKYADGVHGSMTENFGQPPFSILDSRKGDWQDRKRYWNNLIGEKGESREETLYKTSTPMSVIGTVSILDAVLCELMCKWFGNTDFNSFDCFAGDTVFGVVACNYNMSFIGIELRKEQVVLNNAKIKEANLSAKYICDDAMNMDKHIENNSMDLFFTCPPYADLEVYSDNPNDISNMNHNDFFDIYSKCLSNTYNKLKNNRFAIIVISEVRDKNGGYIGLVPKTIDIMIKAGYAFWNELILVNVAGTLPLRAGKTMNASRKVGRMHQNVLIFYKGNQKDIKTDFDNIADYKDANYELQI